MAAGKEVGVLGISKHGGMGKVSRSSGQGNEYGAQTAVGKITGGTDIQISKQKSMQTKFNAKAKTAVGLSMGGHLHGTHHSGKNNGGWKGGR